jgi:hypothetical protein
MTTKPITSANGKQAVPFFGVTNMEASLRFYVDGLGVQNEALVDSGSC